MLFINLIGNVSTTRFITIVSFSTIILICIHLKISGVNGFSEWSWLWREKINGGLTAMIFAYVVFLLGLFLTLNAENIKNKKFLILFLFVLASFLFEYSKVSTHGPALELINNVIESPLLISYFADAKNISYYAGLVKEQVANMRIYSDVTLWMVFFQISH